MKKVAEALSRVPGGEGWERVVVKPNAPRGDRIFDAYDVDGLMNSIALEKSAVVYQWQHDKSVVAATPASTWLPYKLGDRINHRAIFAPHLCLNQGLGQVPETLVADFARAATEEMVKMSRDWGGRRPLYGQMFGFQYGWWGNQSGSLLHAHSFMPVPAEEKDIVGHGLTDIQRLKVHGPLNRLVEEQFNLAVMIFADKLGVGAVFEAGKHHKNKEQPVLKMRLEGSAEMKDYLGAIYKIGGMLNQAYESIWTCQEVLYLTNDPAEKKKAREECAGQLALLGLPDTLVQKLMKTGARLYRPRKETLDVWLENKERMDLSPEVVSKIEKRERFLKKVLNRQDLKGLRLLRRSISDQAGGIPLLDDPTKVEKRITLLPRFGCPFRIFTDDHTITADGKIEIHSFCIAPSFGTDGNTAESELEEVFVRKT